jgi:hypothetical protein
MRASRTVIQRTITPQSRRGGKGVYRPQNATLHSIELQASTKLYKMLTLKD